MRDFRSRTPDAISDDTATAALRGVSDAALRHGPIGPPHTLYAPPRLLTLTAQVVVVTNVVNIIEGSPFEPALV